MDGWFGQGHLDETAYAPASIPMVHTVVPPAEEHRRTPQGYARLRFEPPPPNLSVGLPMTSSPHRRSACTARIKWRRLSAPRGGARFPFTAGRSAPDQRHVYSQATLARGARRHFNVKARGKTGWQNLAILYQINTVKEMSAHCRADPEFGGAIQLYANESASGKRPIRSLAEGTSV